MAKFNRVFSVNKESRHGPVGQASSLSPSLALMSEKQAGSLSCVTGGPPPNGYLFVWSLICLERVEDIILSRGQAFQGKISSVDGG